MLAAVTFGGNRELVDAISEMCAGLGDVCVYKTLHTYPTPEELVQVLGIITPELVLFDLESSDAGLRLAREMRAYHPRTSYLAFSRKDDPALRLRATEAGVAEVLSIFCPPEELREVIGRVVGPQQKAVPDNILAFLPGKAGSGSTTTVLQLASCFASEFRQRVLVLEADVHSGVLAGVLGLQPEHTMMTALDSACQLNESMWMRLVSPAQGFDILTMPMAPEQATLTRWQYQRLLTFARFRYDTVLVDLSDVIEGYVEGIVTQAKGIYVVTTPEKASLLLARRRIEELRHRGAQPHRVHLLLNRCWDSDVSRREAAQTLEQEVLFALPNDDLCPRRSLPQSLPAVRETELGRSFASLARVLAGFAPPPPPPPPVEKKAGLLSMLRSRAAPARR